MKIAIFTKGDQYLPRPELEMWLSLMKEHSIECYFNCDYALSLEKRDRLMVNSYCSVEDLPSGVEMVISYGGDGTFLKCVNLFLETQIPILGINSGRLGFLSNVPRDEVAKAVDAIHRGAYSVEQRSLLCVDDPDAFAFNEFTIQKRELSMIRMKLSINGEYVADYLSDGLIVATPSGSTAYSLSLGGPIVSPSCDCFVINPIAPHNLNVRPLVVEGNAVITVKAESRNNDLLVTLDNQVYEGVNNRTYTIRKSDKKALLVKLPGISFYDTLRRKLMWGVDTRNEG